MKEQRRRDLESAGWQVGSTAEFLGLSKEEATFIEMKLALAEGLKQLRRGESLTQVEVAKLIGSSQSRVAKMEAGDPTVSMDLLVRTLLRLGANAASVAELLENPHRWRAVV
jgi:DNA-binding XRE family transcriptional regulator